MPYRSFEDTQGRALPEGAEAEIAYLSDSMPDAPDGIQIIDDEEGGVSIIIPEESNATLPIPENLPFDANLAFYIKPDVLATIGNDVRTMVKADIESNADWRDDFNNGLKFLGLKVEDRDWVFKGASGAWDTKLLEALIRLHAEIFAELFPSEGPADVKIIGEKIPATVDQSTRVKAWMNYYLTTFDKGYYDDSDQMLNYSIMAGSAFRKGYICPIQRRPVAKYLTPNNVAMSYDASSIYDAQRFTHIFDITPRDLRLLQLQKYYRDVELSASVDNGTDISKDDVDEAAGMEKVLPPNDESFGIYETILDYDLPGFEHLNEENEETGLPLPYKITIDSVGGEVLRIERNWNQARAEKDGLFERKLNVSHWKFMPGFGPFGLGIVQCLGGTVESRTKIKRMLHDSGVFSNFPPTIRVKGMRMEHNRAGLAPGENIEMDTGGLPINQAVQQMAVKEPSLMLKTLYDDDGLGADRLIGNMDIAVGDGRQDAPVGTTIALLQAAKKPQTGVMRRMHRALTHELANFAEMFAVWLPETPYPFPVAGGEMAIMRTDFSATMFVTPVSDPNVMSQTERLMRAQMIQTTSLSLPPNAPPYQIEATRRLYQQMKVDNIDKLLPPLPQEAQPKDPVTENMDAMTGKPLKAFKQQNHMAHIAVHTPLAEGNPAMQAHISEHQAMQYRLMVENMLGFPLPPEGQPIDPEIQERIAMLAAKATQQYMDEQKAKNPPPPTAEEIMLADVEQKRQKEILRHNDEMKRLEVELQIQNIKSDDAAAQRSAALETAKLKTVAATIATAPSVISTQEKVAHINAESSIAVAGIKADSVDAQAAYKHEVDKADGK